MKNVDPITIGFFQMSTMLMESIGESLPQILLQSVFIIRSYNDPRLRGTEIWLLLFSVFASLFSITDKFVKYDDANNAFPPKAAAPKFTSFSKGLCLNANTMWYSLRVLWRLFHVASGMIVYTLIWTVMGGAWLFIFCSFLHLVYCGWQASYWCNPVVIILEPIGHFGGILQIWWFVILVKWGQVVFGLILVAVFATNEFECGICADSTHRTFDNEDEGGMRNNRAAIFYVLGCVSFLAEFTLFWVLKRFEIMKPDGKCYR